MAWFRDTSSNPWTRRQSISIDNTAGAAGTIDATCVVPTDFEEFWTEIDASGNELRVVDADGSTLLAYSLTGFNKTTRVCTINIDAYSAPAQGMLQVFLYWGSSGASSAAVVTAIAAAKTAYLHVWGPASPFVVAAVPERPNEARPRKQFAKGSDETLDIWFDLGPRLSGRVRPAADHYAADEFDYVSYSVTQAGVSSGAMRSDTSIRFFDGRFVRLRVTGGTVDTDYTLVLTATTVDAQKHAARAWLRIRDVDES